MSLNINTVDGDKNYVIDGRAMIGILHVVHRLYEDGKPLKTDERRDLAQRLDALLQHAVVL